MSVTDPKATALEPGEGAASGEDDDLGALGRRLRFFRKLKKMRLKDLAAAAGCSESLLSRVENGIVMPSLTTLHRLSRALGINVAALLSPAEDENCAVYGPQERPRYIRTEASEGDGSMADSLVPFAESRLIEGLLIKLPAEGPVCGPFQHEGEEVGYILSGTLELIVGGERYEVRTGHSFFFSSERQHSYRALGSEDCLAIWVNTPPTF